jgi:SOS-response transcriptional repressor LexA
MKELSPLRKGILVAVALHWQKHDYGPSIRDIQAVIGHSTSVISYNLAVLTGMGLIMRDERVARSIRLIDEGKAELLRLMGEQKHA